MSGAVVRLGTAFAVAGAAHAWLNGRLLRRPPADPPPVASLAAVLIPARDEAGQIADCVAAVLAQTGVVLDVVVLDDRSGDGTAGAVDPRARLVRGRPLPGGWLGKPHACQQLADAADPRAEVLVFLDADVRLAPTAIAATMEVMERVGLDLVSPYPRLEAVGRAERLVQPLLPWSWLTFLPLRLAERSHRPSLVAAGGQFLAVRRPSYARAGGHAAVRDSVLDDLALARAVRRSGGRVGLVDGSAVASCRMYRSWRELADGYGKSLWAAFGSPGGAAAATALLGLAYVVPPAAAVLRRSPAGLLGYAAGVAGRIVTARRTGGRAWPDPLLHPASVVAFGALTARSAWLRRRGALVWKGRTLAGAR